ncbi:MAG: hypothetical protein ACO3ZY_11155, partial [Phycisphaerales bacterium]
PARPGAATEAAPPSEAAPGGEAGPPPRTVPLNWSVSGTLGWADSARLSKILLDLGFANPRTNFSGRGEQMRLPAAPPG